MRHGIIAVMAPGIISLWERQRQPRRAPRQRSGRDDGRTEFPVCTDDRAPGGRQCDRLRTIAVAGHRRRVRLAAKDIFIGATLRITPRIDRCADEISLGGTHPILVEIYVRQGFAPPEEILICD